MRCFGGLPSCSFFSSARFCLSKTGLVSAELADVELLELTDCEISRRAALATVSLPMMSPLVCFPEHVAPGLTLLRLYWKPDFGGGLS